MAKLSRKKGTTSQIIHVFIQDSSSTVGAGLTGLAYTGAGITPTVKYINAGGTLSGSITLEDITTLGTYQAPTANTNMRFKEVNSASPSQGVYELHLHNDWMNLAGGSLIIMLAGATNMAPLRLEIELGAFDNQVALAQTGDAYAIVNNGTYGNAQLVRSTTPANTLDVSTTGEAGLDFNNVKDATGAHTLTNITVPVATTLTNAPSDSSGVTTLLTRVPSAITITTGKVDINDKTGFSLSGTQTYNLTGNITGNLSGSVGSVSGSVNSLTTWDKTGYSIGTGGITSSSFAAGAIDAASLAADATTEITAGIRIKKNTALSNFMFLMVDSTDHVTPKTGLTITATRSIDGAAFAACANSATEVANGMYKINLANTDLNGDVVTFRFTATGADARLITIVTTT